MAGNNKTWRLPVACAASVAMFATVGISAMTASAAPATVAPYNFTVTLDAGTNGGTIGGAATEKITTNASGSPVADGMFTELPSYNASKGNGWTFTGWYLAPEAGAEKFDYNDTFLNKDITLYAHFAEPDDLISITFDDAKGEINGEKTIYVSKDEAKLAAWEIPTDTAGDQKLVTGWTTKAAGSPTSVPVSDETLTSDFSGLLQYANPGTQYIQLDPVTTPAVSVKVWDDTSKTYQITAMDVAYGDTIDLPTKADAYIPAQQRYATAWSDEAGTKLNGTYTASQANANLTNNHDGYWDVYGTAWQKAYKVDFFTEINGIDQQFDSVVTDENTKVDAPTAPARNSGTFSMYTNPAHPGAAHTYDTTAFDSVINQNTTLAAQWAVDSVTVTYDYNYAGKTTSQSYKAGDEFTVPTAERDGYVLMGWYTVKPYPAEFQYANGVLTNGNHDASWFDTYKIPVGAKLRITTTGVLQYFRTVSGPVDGNNEQTTTGQWINIPSTLFAAWQLADNDQLNDAENRVEGIYDENGDYAASSKYFTDASWAQYINDYQTYLAHKTELGKTDGQLSNDEAAELLAELQAAQAKLVQKAGADVYRLYNPYNHGDHLYTTSKAEYDGLLKLGWKGEGVKFHVTAPNKSTAAGFGQAVYRVYNPYNGEHLLTTDSSEVDSLVQLGWQADFDGKPMFYAPQGGDVQVTRLFNPYETVGTHLYTIDQDEVDSNVALGWVKDDVAFAAMK